MSLPARSRSSSWGRAWPASPRPSASPQPGCDVHVLESGPHAGGRLATENIDGFVVDRGFQVLNTGYPRAETSTSRRWSSAGSTAGP